MLARGPWYGLAHVERGTRLPSGRGKPGDPMNRVALHCRSCGWSGEIDSSLLPRYGARLRCEECAGLLPLAVPCEDVPVPSRERDLESEARGRVRDLESEARGGVSESQCENEARKATAEIDLWFAGVRERAGGAMSEAIFWAEHGGELADFFAAWRLRHPGAPARRAFLARLFALTGVKGGATPPGERARDTEPADGRLCP